MIHLTLQRDIDTGNETIGTLHIEGADLPVLYTVERPWLNNKPRASCIPAGTYRFVPHNGTKFKNVWRLENVPGRSAILIHIGNTANAVIGCIAVGLRRAKFGGRPGVADSSKAINLLRSYMAGKSGSITVIDRR